MIRAIFYKIIFFFPVHLLIYHLKKNHVLFAYWLLFGGFVSGTLGSTLGIPYLFLDPEYLNQVGFWSFFIVGVAFCAFTMAYHITCYILDAYRYNFLVALPHPFFRFCVNNSLIPLIFTIYYLVKVVLFRFEEGEGFATIAVYVSGFVLGNVAMLIVLFFYFKSTDQEIFKSLVDQLDRKVKKNTLQRVNIMDRLAKAKRNKAIITSYMRHPLKWDTVHEEKPFDKRTLTMVFDQYQLNALIFQLIMFMVILVLGFFRDLPVFQIPAAASVLLLFTLLLLLSGAITYWLKDWAVTLVVVFFVVFSFLPKSKSKDLYHKAFGIDYNSSAIYDSQRLTELSNAENYHADRDSTLAILNTWKSQFPEEENPKMVILCMSGGGLRSAVWTMRSLQYLDSALQGKLMQHTFLMTGSSGGVIGGAYFRELLLRKKSGKALDLYDQYYVTKLAKDKLNPIIYSFVVGDIFFRFQKVYIDGKSYFHDRGYALDRQILTDTDFMLDKTLKAYQEPERLAQIPMLIQSPTVVNDGRKLYIASQHVSYMNTLHREQSSDENPSHQLIKGIEFRRFFQEQQADSLRFVTALRMNATFPYITPNVLLPSTPIMETVDAGLSDNFGMSDALNFFHVFSDWIAENTSGVILLTIRDTPITPEIDPYKHPTFFEYFMGPVRQLLGNLMRLQDISNHRQLDVATSRFQGDIHTVSFHYANTSRNSGPEKRASLSWRLTQRELQGVINSVNHPDNQQALIILKRLLNSPDMLVNKSD